MSENCGCNTHKQIRERDERIAYLEIQVQEQVDADNIHQERNGRRLIEKDKELASLRDQLAEARKACDLLAMWMVQSGHFTPDARGWVRKAVAATKDDPPPADKGKRRPARICFKNHLDGDLCDCPDNGLHPAPGAESGREP